MGTPPQASPFSACTWSCISDSSGVTTTAGRQTRRTEMGHHLSACPCRLSHNPLPGQSKISLSIPHYNVWVHL